MSWVEVAAEDALALVVLPEVDDDNDPDVDAPHVETLPCPEQGDASTEPLLAAYGSDGTVLSPRALGDASGPVPASRRPSVTLPPPPLPLPLVTESVVKRVASGPTASRGHGTHVGDSVHASSDARTSLLSDVGGPDRHEPAPTRSQASVDEQCPAALGSRANRGCCCC